MNIPTFRPDPAYAAALAEMLSKLGDMLAKRGGPVTMCIAGGAALHIYTGARYSNDVDATLSVRAIIDAEKLNVSYADSAGRTRYLYYDTQYNDSFALMHQDAYDDAIPISIQGVDPRKLHVKLLSPLDLAVSKLSRFSEQDREDIRTLGRAKLFTAKELKARAVDALPDYVGNLDRIRNSIEIAAADVAALPDS